MARDPSIYEPVEVDLDGETVFMPRWLTQVTPQREPKRVRATAPDFAVQPAPKEPRRRLLESLARH